MSLCVGSDRRLWEVALADHGPMVAQHLLMWSHHVVGMMAKILHLCMGVRYMGSARWMRRVCPVCMIGHGVVMAQP